MNITPQFVKSPPFVKFERLVGPEAYKYITLLGMYCQQLRSPQVRIEDSMDLEILLDIEANGENVLNAMLKLGLMEKIDEVTYLCNFFMDQNKQLLSNWRNGQMKSNQARAGAINKLSKDTLEVVTNRINGSALDQCPSGATPREGGGFKFNG